MNKNGTVVGPDGTPISVADLPPKDTKRWVIKKKAIVVYAVTGGLITINEACKRYSLSLDEFLSWKRAIDRHGISGLRSTHLQRYRGR